MKNNTLIKGLLINAAIASLIVGSLRASDNPIASSVASLPGYGISGQCLYFARAAALKLRAAGFKNAHVVSFVGIEQPEFAFGLNVQVAYAPKTYAHAVVIFERDGQTFAFDNQFAHSSQRVGKPGQDQSDFACVSRMFPNVVRLTNYK
jgi:hypothetical protein